MPSDNISFRVYEAFQRHAKEHNMFPDEANRACVFYFQGAFDALGTEERSFIKRMIENAKKRGFVSYSLLTQAI